MAMIDEQAEVANKCPPWVVVCYNIHPNSLSSKVVEIGFPEVVPMADIDREHKKLVP